MEVMFFYNKVLMVPFGIGLLLLLCVGEIKAKETDYHDIIKRETGNITEYTVELLLVVDYSIYQYWIKDYQDDDVDGQIFRHYDNVVNEVNARYSSIKGHFTIEIAIADIIILKNQTESLWIEQYHNGATLDAIRTLTYFRDWIQITDGLPEHDHAMLFTWYDLYKDGSDSVAGLAYTGTMCTRSSVSIVEDRVYGQTFHVAAHELAHSLGSRHDGKLNLCYSKDNFIMADMKKVTGDIKSNRNSWKFSKCSVDYFSLFIKKLEKEGNNCLNERVRRGNFTAYRESTNTSSMMDVPAPTPDVQCEMLQGNSSHLCRHFYKRNYTDFCALMFCSSKDDRTCQFRLPIDGTPCGHNKKCHEGFCVGEAAASGTNGAGYSDDCMFGDQPGVLYETNKGCTDTMKREPYKCYEEDGALRCCRTCKTLYTSVKGCEYGDKEPMCKTATRFHCFMHADTCCELCKDFSGFVIKVIVPAGLGFVIVTVILLLYCRYYCKQRKSKQTTEDTTNTDKGTNIKKLEQDTSVIPAMNGFRAAGSRHQPMFQYDRVAQLAALTTNQQVFNNLQPQGGVLNNGFVNEFNGNPMLAKNGNVLSRSASMYQHTGHDNDYPGSDVMMQPYTPARHQNFDLRKFGQGPYSWSVG